MANGRRMGFYSLLAFISSQPYHMGIWQKTILISDTISDNPICIYIYFGQCSIKLDVLLIAYFTLHI